MKELIDIMARLRDPDSGCPWDLQQDFASIAPYTIEEAYEVADAIERGDYAHLRDELGDLLFQVVFHSRMAEEAGHFAIDDVVASICDKMRRRHPHVFGDAKVEDAQAQTRAWEEHKAREREQHDDPSALAGIPLGLPELLRGYKLQKRAARIGFDWPQAGPVLDKVAEEVEELREEMNGDADAGRLEDELGDLLFATINLSRHLGVDAGRALRRANGKFERRFRAVEDRCREQGMDPAGVGLEVLDGLWEEVKRGEVESSK